MIERFQGAEGKHRLLDAVRCQGLVRGSTELVQVLTDALELRELAPGTTLIAQGGHDNDLFLILAGTFEIQINGRSVTTRGAGTHVGEMAFIDPSAPRSATVIARSTAVVGRIPEAAFSSIASRFPLTWKELAFGLATRLRERSRSIHEPNPRPVVFLGSSTEGLSAARALFERLDDESKELRLWTNGVFEASYAAIEDLMAFLHRCDFAILVATQDDTLISRGGQFTVPRDNIVFEIGASMGVLGRYRVLLVQPEGSELRLPSDLLGLTTLRFTPDLASGSMDLVAAAIQKRIDDLRPK